VAGHLDQVPRLDHKSAMFRIHGICSQASRHPSPQRQLPVAFSAFSRVQLQPAKRVFGSLGIGRRAHTGSREGSWREIRATDALTAHQRQEAIQRLANGEAQADVARSFNVSQATAARCGWLARWHASKNRPLSRSEDPSGGGRINEPLPARSRPSIDLACGLKQHCALGLRAWR